MPLSLDNAYFITLDKYSHNLDILENKTIIKDARITYLPGEGFEEIKASIGNDQLYNYEPILTLLRVIFKAFHKIYLFGEIKRKTQEIRTLAKELGIPPKKAFEQRNMIYQSSLFD